MRFRSKLLLSVGVGLLGVMSLLAYRTLQATEQIVLTPYGVAKPAIGDIVVIDMPTRPDSSQALQIIDAVPGDTVEIGGRSQIVPVGYYYTRQSSGRVVWGFVPKKYILGKVELRAHIHTNPSK